MDAVSATLIGTGVAAFGIGAAFAGVLIGQRMARNTQRQQWILDNRKTEYRELLTAISESLRLGLSLNPGLGFSGEEDRKAVEANAMSMRVIRDRIFIADMVESMNLEERWAMAIMKHRRTYDASALITAYREVSDELVKLAVESA
jgi:hypothetical protein